MVRQRKNWDNLYQQWLGSGLSKAEFLKTVGINPRSGSVGKATKGWRTQATKETKAMIETTIAAGNSGGHKKKGSRKKASNKTQDVPVALNLSKVEIAKAIGLNFEQVNPKSHPATWQMIDRWQKKQALEDYKTSDDIRKHVKMFLADSIEAYIDSDGTKRFRSKLSPQELRAISEVAERIQRIQRLTLGLSTENMGIPLAPSGDPEPNDGEEPSDDGPMEGEIIPIFQVEMNEDGRFVHRRPRRTQ